MKKPTILRTLMLCVCLWAGAARTHAQTVVDSTDILFDIDTVARNLGYPWEITYGNDNHLWITEARGYRVVRINSNRTQADMATPAQQVMRLPLNAGDINFGRGQEDIDPTASVTGRWPQGGMMGMVLHPLFSLAPYSNAYVYLSYVYKVTACPNSNTPCYYRSKIVRCQFYPAAHASNPSLRFPKQDSLVIIDTILSNLPGSNDHNSGRMTISPVPEGGSYKLYYSIGDQGAGQFNNASRMLNPQTRDTCEGKILRLNTEPDGDISFGVTHDFNTWRQWIPNDNPFYHSVAAFSALKTPIFSYGHRNPQGLAWGFAGSSWKLYSSEHGDKSDDEVNIIVSGGNYGWPRVAGMADNNYSDADAFANNNILAGQTVSWGEATWATTNGALRPMFATFNPTAANVPSSGANIFTWPTIAPSSIDFYTGGIPGWRNSLLVTSLKYGMYRLKLKAAGDFVDSSVNASLLVDTFPLLHSWRVRDIAIRPLANSGTMWVVLDSSGSTSGPTGGFGGGSAGTKSPGMILKMQYRSLITLPTEFVNFNGKLLSNSTVKLDWLAYPDLNHDYFEVERSINNSTYEVLGRISGQPPYQLIDPSPKPGNNYYRIKQMDKNGVFAYSRVINIVYDPPTYTTVTYSNPVMDQLAIRFNAPKPEKVIIQIADMQGRIITRQTRSIAPGVSEVSIDAGSWSAQVYSLKIMGDDGKVITAQKIVKL